MECQSSEPFDMGNMHLQNSAQVTSGTHRGLRVKKKIGGLFFY